MLVSIVYGHLGQVQVPGGKVLCFGGCGQGAERGGMIRDMNVQREESDKNSSPDTTELQDSVYRDFFLQSRGAADFY